MPKTSHYPIKPGGLPQTGFVRLPQVLSVFPVSKSAWFQGIREGRYPKPVKLSKRTSGYRVSDVRELLASVEEDQADD